MAFLRRELIGGLALIVGVIGLVESHLAVTPLVLALLAFGGLWTAVVVIHALLMRRRNAGYPANQESPSPEMPKGSFIIGGPGQKVRRSSIEGSYSNNPEGFGGIYGDVEDSSMEDNIHDVPDPDKPERVDEDG